MRVKLQPASSSQLPAFSPLTPPAVISQVLLLDNPHKVCAGVSGSGRRGPGRGRRALDAGGGPRAREAGPLAREVGGGA